MTNADDKRDPKVIFKKYCEDNDMRYTPERDIIIEEFYRKYEHFDIDTLFFRIRKNYADTKLAKGSIYRTLPHLIDAGLIRISFIDQGNIYYERTVGHSHHDHMRCLDCGKIYDFFSEEIENIQESIAKKLKFTIDWQMHVLSGYCEKCNARKVK